MRLVDADWLLEALSHFNDREHGNKHFFYGIESAKEIIENADKVEIIKCNDCDFYNHIGGYCISNSTLFEDDNEYHFYSDPDDFCCWAKRMDSYCWTERKGNEK